MISLMEFRPKSEAVVKHSKIDKAKFPVIDFHTHMGKLLLGSDYAEKYDTGKYNAQMDLLNIKHSVNLDGFYGKDLAKMQQKINIYKDRITTFMWIDFDDFAQDNFTELTRERIIRAYKQGARGIKLWKDITLYKKIRTDHPKCDVIYQTAAELNIPILIHVGDPVAFFKEVDQYNERYEELIQNPDWKFSDRTKYPSFNELLQMQENMIAKHPETTFVVAHVGSYAENLSWVGEQLDRYSNMYIDIAARIAELGRVPYSARRFFIRYANRILFGSDSTPIHLQEIKNIFRFLETDDEYFPYQPEGEMPGQGRFAIYGLYLPDEVLRAVYYENACAILGLNRQMFEAQMRENL